MDALFPFPRPKVFVIDDDEAVRDSIKVPVESVLTFQLDKPLKITAMQ